MQINNFQKGVSLVQTASEKLRADSQVNRLNSELKAKGIKYSQKLGQDHFLKLLVTQLKHQDPLSPMKDKDFIAQMAQFSSLEQMTKVNKSIGSLLDKTSESANYQLIGKKITWVDQVTERLNKGIVSSLMFKEDDSYLVVGKAEVNRKEIVRVELASGED